MTDETTITQIPHPQAEPETLSQAMTPEAWRARVMWIFNRAVAKDNLTVATQNQDMLARHLQYYERGMPAHDAVKEITESMVIETESLRAELEAKPKEPKTPRTPSRLRKPPGEKPSPEAWLAEMIDVYEDARAQDKIGAAQRTLDGIGRHLGYLGAQLKVAKILSRAEKEARLDEILKAADEADDLETMTFEEKVETVALIERLETLESVRKKSKYELLSGDELMALNARTRDETIANSRAYADAKAPIAAREQAQTAPSSNRVVGTWVLSEPTPPVPP